MGILSKTFHGVHWAMASMYATSSALDSSHRMNSNGSILEMPHYISIPAEVFQDLSSNDLSNITGHHGTVSNHDEMVLPSPPSEQIFRDALDEDQGIAIASSGPMMMEVEVEEVQCEYCRIEEECTATYIAHIRASYCGKWICGICAEAVKEEQRKKARENPGEDNMEETLEYHMEIFKEFNKKPDEASYPGSPVAHMTARFISALKEIRLLHCPSRPIQDIRINRSKSCINSFFSKSDFTPP